MYGIYGPYAHCRLDKGVACAQHIQLLTHTCARAWYACALTSPRVSKCVQTQGSLGNMKILLPSVVQLEERLTVGQLVN